MYVCGSLCVFVDGWPKEGSYLWSWYLWKEGKPLICIQVYFQQYCNGGLGMPESLKQRQSVLRVVLCLSILTRRPHKELCSREPVRPEVRGEKDEGRWSVTSEAPAVESQTVRNGNGTSSSEDDDLRWVRIFSICREFHNSLVIAKCIHTHSVKKVSDFTLRFAVLIPCFVFSSFHHLLLSLLLFFVQLGKCPLSRVWEEITGSTPLDKRPANLTRRVGYFIV